LGSFHAAAGHYKRPDLHFLPDYSVATSETYAAFDIGFEWSYWAESLSVTAQIDVFDAVD
jgi:hypothetical protein